MITWIQAPESLLDKEGIGVKRRRTTPVDVLQMLEDFMDQEVAFAEVVGWEEHYNSAHSLYTSLVKQCARYKYPIEVMFRGGQVFLRRY